METVIEILLRRKMTFIDKIGLVCAIFVVIFLSIIGMCLSKFIFSFMPLVFFLDCFIIYLIILHRQIEFEYTVVGSEIDVDKIIGKRKRKRLITVKKTDVVFFGNVNDEKYQRCKKGSRKVINASSDKFNEENCYMLLSDTKKTLVILDRNEVVLKVMKR